MTKPKGAAYSNSILSVLAVAFLVFIIPSIAGLAVKVAYNSSEVTTGELPDRGSYPFPPEGGVEWVTLEDNPSNKSFYEECQKGGYFLQPSFYYPSTNYTAHINSWSGHYHGDVSWPYAAWLHDPNQTWIWAGSPFYSIPVGSGPLYCSTYNDVIGIRLQSDIFPTGESVAVTRFNASWVKANAPSSDSNHTRVAEFDWWVEIDGVYMFGEQIRNVTGEHDQYTLDPTEGFVATPNPPIMPGWSATHYVTINFEKNLTVDEEARVRVALAQHANSSSLNVTLNWKCLTGECEIVQDDVGSLNDDDIFIRAEVEYIWADDYDLVIQSAALIMGTLCLLVAIASTSYWNPLKRLVRGR